MSHSKKTLDKVSAKVLLSLILRLPKSAAKKVLLEMGVCPYPLIAFENLGYDDLRKRITRVRRHVLSSERQQLVKFERISDTVLQYYEVFIEKEAVVKDIPQWVALEAEARTLLRDIEETGGLPPDSRFESLRDVLEGKTVMDITVSVQTSVISMRIYVIKEPEYVMFKRA